MSDAWKNMNKASREFNRNPTPKNKKKLEKAESAYEASKGKKNA